MPVKTTNNSPGTEPEKKILEAWTRQSPLPKQSPTSDAGEEPCKGKTGDCGHAEQEAERVPVEARGGAVAAGALVRGQGRVRPWRVHAEAQLVEGAQEARRRRGRHALLRVVDDQRVRGPSLIDPPVIVSFGLSLEGFSVYQEMGASLVLRMEGKGREGKGME